MQDRNSPGLDYTLTEKTLKYWALTPNFEGLHSNLSVEN